MEQGNGIQRSLGRIEGGIAKLEGSQERHTQRLDTLEYRFNKHVEHQNPRNGRTGIFNKDKLTGGGAVAVLFAVAEAIRYGIG